MTRKSAQDWLEAGLHALGKEGAGSLTVEGLCTQAGVTKGSFYHHFPHFDDFKNQMLAYWEDTNTSRIIEVMDQAQTPDARYRALLTTPTRFSDQIEVAIRAWALQDDTVRAYQARVDQRRIDSVEQIFMGYTADPDRARVLAQMMYAIYIGCMQTIPPIEGQARSQVFEAFQKLHRLYGDSSA